MDPRGRLLICDIGNHRIRQVDLSNGTITTYSGTGEREPTPDGADVKRAPLNGPRTIVISPSGDLYLALREGNAIYRIAPTTATIHHLAGTGEQGYSGDGGPARVARLAGPKGLGYARGHLYVADTENHVVRRYTPRDGRIARVAGSGREGAGGVPGPALEAELNQPHGVAIGPGGLLYIVDSSNHRVLRLEK